MADLTKMGPMGLNGLSAAEAAARLEAGDITSEALVRDCLARIDARDDAVRAWDCPQFLNGLTRPTLARH